jgi:hypothetical protein
MMSNEAAVRALDDEERHAALTRDAGALRRLWSEEFTVNAPNNQVVSGKESVLATFVDSGVIDFSTYERSIEFIREDTPFVFIMGLETLMPNVDAPSAGLKKGQSVRRRFTNIWKNEAGTWRLWARHANVMKQLG